MRNDIHFQKWNGLWVLEYRCWKFHVVPAPQHFDEQLGVVLKEVGRKPALCLGVFNSQQEALEYANWIKELPGACNTRKPANV